MPLIDLAGSVGTVLLLVGGCCGLGAGCLAACGLIRSSTRLEALAWSFALGFGLLGWIMFFPGVIGLLGWPCSAVILLVGLPGLWLLKDTRAEIDDEPAGWIVWLLLWIAFAGLAAIDLAEALSPPVDADSLAYHFALPREFLASGGIRFVPRVADGAVPLLIQMSYLAAYSIGGEMAMTLFSGVSTWMAGLLIYVAARVYMKQAWAFAVALIFLSTPAVLYGGGSGQIEPKIVLFVVVAAIAVVRVIATNSLAYAGIAGIAVGLVVGSKYTGLLYGAAATLPMLMLWRSPKAIVLYCGIAGLVALPWYVWIWWHTGDPVFPVLYEFLGLPDSSVWTAAQDAVLRAVHANAERPLPRSLLWFFWYPFHATLAPIDAIEAGRTGFGPYVLILLPFFAVGLWKYRTRITMHPLFIIAIIAFAYYLLWFATGVSQRLRHLLPIWPLVLICVTAVAARYSDSPRLRRVVPVAAGLTLVIQLGGQAVFGLSYLRHLATSESREAFLERSVSQYGFVKPTEAEMTPADRVLIDQRQLVYLFATPVFYYHYADQAEVVARNAATEPARFLAELHRLHITHILVPAPVSAQSDPSDLSSATAALVAVGCALPVRSFAARAFVSRTLSSQSANPVEGTLYKLTADGCRP